MCTLTLLRSGHGSHASGADEPRARLVMNRDERRTRPHAHGPRVIQCVLRVAIMPVDPLSGGTWIGCNDRGVAACLLNSTQDARTFPPGHGLRSRGTVVPILLAASDLSEALEIAISIDAQSFPAFRLLITDGQRHAVVRADGVAMIVEAHAGIGEGVMLTSSGLGDELVQQPRRVAFERLLMDAHAGAAPGSERAQRAQDGFHSGTGGEESALNVCMARLDARTVSITTIEFFQHSAAMAYSPLGEDLRSVGTPELASITFENAGRLA